MDLDQIKQNIQDSHLRDGVELLSATLTDNGEMDLSIRLEDGSEISHTLLSFEIKRIAGE